LSERGTPTFPALGLRRSPRVSATRFQRLNGEQGSNLVEFALIILVLMTMMLGIIDFCRAAYAYHFVSNAAREATRYAAVRGSTCNADSSCSQATPDTGPAAPGNTVIQDYVNSIVSAGLDPKQVTTTPNWPVQANSPAICNTAVTGIGPATANYPGCTVEVTVSYNFSFIFPLVYKPFSSTGTITLSSTSEMVIVH
jgi:Flp pilus assembly protein TadG